MLSYGSCPRWVSGHVLRQVLWCPPTSQKHSTRWIGSDKKSVNECMNGVPSGVYSHLTASLSGMDSGKRVGMFLWVSCLPFSLKFWWHWSTLRWQECENYCAIQTVLLLLSITHALSLTLLLAVPCFLSLPLFFLLSLPLSHSLSFFFLLPLPLSCSFSCFLFRALSPSLFLSLALSLTLFLALPHFLSLLLFFLLSLSCSLFLTLSLCVCVQNSNPLVQHWVLGQILAWDPDSVLSFLFSFSQKEIPG